MTVIMSVLVCVSPEGHQCYYCEPNTFCFVDTQYQCPPHSSSPAGSDDLQDCVCHAGYYRDQDEGDTDVCKLCEADFYCPGGLEQLRLPCPADTVSIPGSTHVCVGLSARGLQPSVRLCFVHRRRNQAGDRQRRVHALLRR